MAPQHVATAVSYKWESEYLEPLMVKPLPKKYAKNCQQVTLVVDMVQKKSFTKSANTFTENHS